MEHLDFIAWMVAFPLSQAIIEAIKWRYCERREYSDGVRGFASLVMLIIWLGIGRALW